MMKLSKKNWLVWFAFGKGVPRRTTVCELFWLTVCGGACVTIVTLLIFFCVYIFWDSWPTSVYILGGSVGFGLVVAGLIWLCKYFRERAALRSPLGVLIAGVKAIASRWCPIVEIVDDDDHG